MPISAYGQSKLAAEQAATEFADRVPLSIVRPPVVFGPGDRNRLQLFKSVQLLRLHLVPGYRRMPMSIVHVADLCEGIIQIAERGARVKRDDPTAGIYYITSGPTITYGEMGAPRGAGDGTARVGACPRRKSSSGSRAVSAKSWAACAASRGSSIGTRSAKPWPAAGNAATKNSARELGYRPALPLEQRFADTVAWYREHGWL